jgi:alkanesulfonate monooxygenase SsuD/methylene tetrahydromethanopterin reductase-like flavin-dependent oxidoreductase (luciferase family)
MKRDLSRRRFLRGLGAAAAGGVLVDAARLASAAQPPSPATGAMRFGVTANQGAPYEEIVAFWKECEGLGFDSAFVFDHFMGLVPGPPAIERCWEGWTLLTALAVQTSRLRLGMLVSGNTYRYPQLVAKMACTVDHVSRGRLIVGLGAGWVEREHTAYGIPFYATGVRARRLAEAVEVIRFLLAREHTTFRGKFYTLANAPCAPPGVQRPHPPILVGGMGPKVILPAAARHAQIWHFFKPTMDVAEAKALCATFDRVCGEVGRDPKEVEKATSLVIPAGSAGLDELRIRLRGLRDAGVRHVIFLPPPPEDRKAVERVAREVLPEFRTA